MSAQIIICHQLQSKDALQKTIINNMLKSIFVEIQLFVCKISEHCVLPVP